MSDISIYSGSGELRSVTPVNIGSKRVRMLGGDNYALLKLSSTAPIPFAVGDWAEVEGETMYVVSLPECSVNAETGGYDYSLRLEGAERLWANRLLRLHPSGAAELSFKLTAPVSRHLDIILSNLACSGLKFEATMGDIPEDFTYETDDSVTEESRLVTYEGESILSALDLIASVFECEWWREGAVIHFGSCFAGEEILLERGHEVSAITPSGDTGNAPNRLHAFGGSDNVPPWYRRHLVMKADNDTQGAAPTITTDRPLVSAMFRESARRLPEGRETQAEIVPAEVKLEKVMMNLTSGFRYNLLPGKYSVDTSGIRFKVSYFDKNGNPYPYVSNTLQFKIEITNTCFPDKGGGTKVITAATSVRSISNPDRKSELFIEAPAINTIELSIPQGCHGYGLLDTQSNEDEQLVADKKYCIVRYIVSLEFEGDSIHPNTNPLAGLSVTVEGGGPLTVRAPETSLYPSFEGLTLRNLTSGDLIKNVTYNPDNEQPHPDYEMKSLPFLLPPGTEVRKGDRLIIEADTLNRPMIPDPWWTDPVEEAVTDAAVSLRLRLPEGTDHIDSRQNLPDCEAVEAFKTYDDIFPKQDYHATFVCSVAREDTNAQGSDRNYRIWYLYDSDMRMSQECIIAKEGLRIRFTGGTLNGMTFEAIMRSGTEETAMEGRPCFEIIRNDDYGRLLPNDLLHPAEGDTFNLLGWADDGETDRLISEAEDLLLEKATEEMEKAATEGKTFECRLLPAWARGNGIPSIGRCVSLHAPELFPRGQFRSRVLGYEYPLDIPFDNPTLTVGDKLPKKRLEAIEAALRAMGSISDTSYREQNSEGFSGIFIADLSNQADAIAFNDLGERIGTLPSTRVSAWVNGKKTTRFSLSLDRSYPGLGLTIEGDLIRVTSADPAMEAETEIEVIVTSGAVADASGAPAERRLPFTLIRRRAECRYQLSLSATSLHRRWDGPMHPGSDYQQLAASVIMEDASGTRVMTQDEMGMVRLRVEWRTALCDWQTTKPDLTIGDQWIMVRLMNREVCLDLETIPIVCDGKPEIVKDTGLWFPGSIYLNEETSIHDVWYNGNLWRCEESHTSSAADAPGFGNPLWQWIGGDPELHLAFAEPEQLYMASDIRIPLTLVATYHGEDVTRFIADADVVWTRESETAAGTPRTALDEEWNALHAPDGDEPYGKSVTLTEEDCQTELGGYAQGVGRLTFIAEATLTDPVTRKTLRSRGAFKL